MDTTNGKIGNATERSVIGELRKRGYWVYQMPPKVGGQPVDIIAIRGGTSYIVWLIDGKHVRESSPSFPLSRIEPNQWACMAYARDFSKIENLGFAIEFDRAGTIYWLPYDMAKNAQERGEKSIRLNILKTFAEVLDENDDKQ